MARLPIGTRKAMPPAGWLRLNRTLFGLRYRWARPAVCPGHRIARLAEVGDWMARNTRWQRNDTPGRDLWGNQRQVRMRGVMGPRLITEGECEDLALVAWARCRDAGVPLGALRIASAVLPDGATGHAVLVVETAADSLIWDCRHGRFWQAAHPAFNHYHWIAASAPGAVTWFQIEKPVP